VAQSSNVSDRELLDRFALKHQEVAFEALVQRHGPMVLRVCRGVLSDRHLAEDAFQATFLVLVRKLSSIHKHTSLGSWLYKVAYRVALRAGRVAAQRRLRESQAPARVAPDPLGDVTWREVQAIFDEELQRLPEKYQAPVILCCLEGRARDEAAQQLGWSLGTLKGRLERGRELLRARLVRRGVALSAALAATLLSEGAVSASVPPTLTKATVRAALVFSSGGEVAAGILTAPIRSLVQGVTRTMALTKLKITATLMVAASLFVAGVGTAARQVLSAKGPDTPAGGPSPRPTDAEPPGPAEQGTVRADRHGDPLPAGAVARLGTARFRHMHTISSLAYSGNGKRILSGSWDGTVRLWDAATGQELCRLRESGDGFSSVALSPDGTLLAGGNMGRTLCLWDAATGKPIRRVKNLENTVFGLRFAPDGKTLAGASGHSVRVWDVATGREVRRLTGPRQDMRPFTLSGDLRTLVAGLPDGSLQLWDLARGTEERKFPTGQKSLMCLALSPDGKVLATGGTEDDRTARVWDRATGRELRRFGPYAGWVESLAFAPDGRTLAVGEQSGTIHVYDGATGKERCRCGLRERSWVRALAFAPDGRTLAAGGTNERAVRFFDAATGEEQHLFGGHQNEVVAAALTPDGKTLVSASKDGAVYLWDLSTGQEVRHWRANAYGISALAVAPDGRSLAIAGDPTLGLWDTATGKEVRPFRGHQGAAGAVAFAPDGKTLASGTWQDHTIRLWDVATGRERLRIKLPMPKGHNYGDVPLAFAADGKVLLSGSADRMNPSIYFWDPATGKELRRIECPISRLALSPDGKTLATTGWDKQVRLWDVGTGKEAARIPASASALAFSRDGRTLAYGGTDGVIHLWEAASGQERHVFAGHQPGGDAKGTFAAGVAVLAFAPDGRTLISGGGDTTLLLWDVLGSGLHAPTRRGPMTREDLWAALAADAPEAYGAIGALLAARSEAVSLLKAKLRPAAPCDPQRLARLIVDLDSDQFAVRERATHDLEQFNESAVPGLRKALAGDPAPEARRRLVEVLQRLESPPNADRLRPLRAVETLEHIGTAEARQVLQTLARGAPEARLTREAKASLGRLGRVPSTLSGRRSDG
jgi:RNA polymerase sigma factor (sigma-70 family)